MSAPNAHLLVPPRRGEVRNPKGRAKGSLNLATRIRRILARDVDWSKVSNVRRGLLEARYGKVAYAEAMILAQAEKALEGDTQSFKVLAEAGWGKAISVDGEVRTEVTHVYKPEKLEAMQIDQQAEQLRERALKAVEAEVVDELDSPSGTTDLRITNT